MAKTSINTVYKTLQYWLFCILLFFSPLIFVSNTKELFEFPKTFFLYLLGAVIVFCFVVKSILVPSKLKTGSKLVWAFVLSYFLSTLLSSHMYTSMWGYYSRFMGGFVSIVVLALCYLVFINTFDKKDAEQLLVVSLVPLYVISLLSVLQHFGVFVVNSPVARVYATFGQPNWLAQYLGMQAFVILGFVFNSKSKVMWCVLYLLVFVCLWFTYSVSGIFAWFVGVAYFGYLVWKKTDGKLLGLLTLMCLVVALGFPGIFGQKLKDVSLDLVRAVTTFRSNIKPAGEVDGASSVVSSDQHALSDSGQIRFGIWEGTLKLVFASPKNFIAGTGPQTFPYAFQSFRPLSLNYSSEWNYIINRPHNYYLELFAETGLLGLGMWLGLNVKFLRHAPKLLKPSGVVFVITNFFSWPVVATWVLFFFWLALLEVKDAS